MAQLSYVSEDGTSDTIDVDLTGDTFTIDGVTYSVGEVD